MTTSPSPPRAVDVDQEELEPGDSELSAAPPVVAVIVAHDPGDWLEEAMASFANQDYEALSVLVINSGTQSETMAERVGAALPNARLIRAEDNEGFGSIANRVLELVDGAAFYLLCHDDVALAPDAVRNLVEEAFRNNAGILGPKLVDWNNLRRIRSVGGAIDKTGVPSPYAEPDEIDQEQHDAVRDVFYISGGATLVRADLFRSLGGFDPAIDYLGDDVDLCWRAHLAGARVMVVPTAVARHLEALGERRESDDRRRLQQRHRIRSMLVNYRPVQLLRVAPQALLVSALELIAALVSLRPRHAADVVGAWTWNLFRFPQLLKRRRTVNALRVVSDSEIRGMQVRGSARLTAFFRGQLGRDDDRLNVVAATVRGLSERLRNPLSRMALIAATLTVGLMLMGSRNLLFQPIPAVGELAAFPQSPLDLLRSHSTYWRVDSGGGPGPSPTGIGAFGMSGLLTLGSMGAARKLLILGLMLTGPFGAWRLSRPIGSVRAGAAAVIVYAAIPVPYNALAGGAWSALAVYAVVPWVLLILAQSTRLAPYGPIDLPSETARQIAPSTTAFGRILGLGLAMSVGAIFTPAIVPLVLLIAVGLTVGSVATIRVAGVARVAFTAVGAVAIVLMLHNPWSVSVLGGGGGWAAVVGADDTRPSPLAQLLRFQTGPFGNTPLGWAFLVAAALPLIIGRGWRLAWATRAWFVALSSWIVLFLAEQDLLPFDLPAAELVLAPAAAGLALSAALGMAAFEVDLRHFRFGWRQMASVMAAISVLIGGLTLAPGVFDGRWQVPRTDLNRPLASTLERDGDPDATILWVGDRAVMPLGGQTLENGLSINTTRGLPEVDSRFVGPRQPATNYLASLLDNARDRKTVRIGDELARFGIRYVVLPTRAALSGSEGGSVPPPDWLIDSLDSQVDLEPVPIDPALIVYRNTAWWGLIGEVTEDGIEPIKTTVESEGRITAEVKTAATVMTALPAKGWTMTSQGGETSVAKSGDLWAGAYEVPAGKATLRYESPNAYLPLVALQPVIWLVALVLRGREKARAERHRRGPVATSVQAPVDPVAEAGRAIAAEVERNRSIEGGRG